MYRISLFFIIGFLLVLPIPAMAQDGSLRLVTSPLPISLVAEPGSTISTALKVKNSGTNPEQLKIDILKFNAYEDSGKPRIMDPEPSDDYIHWVQFSEPTFTLLPEEWKTITATFTLPETAAFGYYYAFVFTRVDTLEELAPQQTAVVGGAATLVLLEARVPNAKREVAVTEFSTDHQMYEFLPTTFTVALRNSGNVHVAPRGNIFISRGNDKDIALLEINSSRGNILPNSTRMFDTQWKDGFPLYEPVVKDGAVVLDETGQTVLHLKWNWQDAAKLRFGKYTAKLLLVYDDGERDVPIEGIVTFWVVPWRLIGGSLFILLFFFVGIRSTLIKLWRKFFPHPMSVA
ncbi:MAG: hypothetical protein E6P95_03860 [Candidatus Moraniibacteriota bacterium]|nr:MAG: hypothetical protein E6P95_03860 [Candidatus Moranbacteria bacterium]